MNNSIPDLAGIKNIVFDFGRVLLNIDPYLTQKGLTQLGYRPHDEKAGAKDDEVVVKLEQGKISPEEFLDEVLEVLIEGTTKQQVIDAWNAMLLDFPQKHLKTIQQLKQNYKVFLLSNSNQIHYDHYSKTFYQTYGIELEDLFDKTWFSFNIGVIKPETDIFRFILSDGKLNPEETLFIDDTLVHVQAARSIGIKAYHLTDNEDVSDLFPSNL